MPILPDAGRPPSQDLLEGVELRKCEDCGALFAPRPKDAVLPDMCEDCAVSWVGSSAAVCA